jgi:hypothetical protein
MTQKRQKEWQYKLFHQLRECAQSLASVFDIQLMKNLKPEEKEFAILMFHRRHIYEHNGGEVTEKYLADSGDTSVVAKQSIHETRESVSKLLDLILKLGNNYHAGFHAIFPPEGTPIKIHQHTQNR